MSGSELEVLGAVLAGPLVSGPVLVGAVLPGTGLDVLGPVLSGPVLPGAVFAGAMFAGGVLPGAVLDELESATDDDGLATVEAALVDADVAAVDELDSTVLGTDDVGDAELN